VTAPGANQHQSFTLIGVTPMSDAPSPHLFHRSDTTENILINNTDTLAIMESIDLLRSEITELRKDIIKAAHIIRTSLNTISSAVFVSASIDPPTETPPTPSQIHNELFNRKSETPQ